MPDFTASQVADALKGLGHYRVLRVQQVALQGPPDGISGALILAMGLRESRLRNVNGGARWDDHEKEWVATKDDRGWLQINDHYHATWLKSVPGCLEGEWRTHEGHTAYEEGHCPRFSDALDFTIASMHDAQEYADDRDVPRDEWARFAVAAHNAGKGGAYSGWKAGDVDKFTALGDYSAWTIRHRTKINSWLKGHPAWTPDGQ